MIENLGFQENINNFFYKGYESEFSEGEIKSSFKSSYNQRIEEQKFPDYSNLFQNPFFYKVDKDEDSQDFYINEESQTPLISVDKSESHFEAMKDFENKEEKTIKNIFPEKEIVKNNIKKENGKSDTLKFVYHRYIYNIEKTKMPLEFKLFTKSEKLPLLYGLSKKDFSLKFLETFNQDNDLIMELDKSENYSNGSTADNSNKKIRADRKIQADSIKQKIKSIFFNNLRIAINNLLKGYKFKKLASRFANDISIKNNNDLLENTLYDILSIDFSSYYSKNNDIKECNFYRYNKNILNKVKTNKDIIPILNMTYSEILNEYFYSKQFEDSIYNLLKKEGYIFAKKYTYLGLNFLDFYKKYEIVPIIRFTPN